MVSKHVDRTFVAMNLNKPQRSLLKYICELENRSVSQQVEHIVKKGMDQWVVKNMEDLQKRTKVPDFIKKAVTKPTALIK